MSGRKMVARVCQECGRDFTVRESVVRLRGGGKFCSQTCNGAYQRRVGNLRDPGFGPAHRAWSGGRTIKNGYVVTRVAGNHERREHVEIAERALGKQLPPQAVVHHFNRDRSDNANSNLVICENERYHRLLHALDRVRSLGGRPFIDAYCPSCHQAKPYAEFYPAAVGPFGCSGWCRACTQMKRKARRTAA